MPVNPELIAIRLHSRQRHPTQHQPIPARKPSHTLIGYISNAENEAQPSAPRVLSHLVHTTALLLSTINVFFLDIYSVSV